MTAQNLFETGNLLAVSGLRVTLGAGTVLRGVDLAIRPGEAVGLVGESGSGKSMTARAIGRLLPRGARSAGTITFDGTDVGALDGKGLRNYRGQVAMVFQDPRAHVNPVRRIGDFMTEALRTNAGVRKARGLRSAPPTCSARSGSTRSCSPGTRTSCPAACCSGS